MNRRLFRSLIKSIKEAGKIKRGEIQASRLYTTVGMVKVEKSETVFCSRCKHFETIKGYLHNFDYCRHPNNLSYRCDWKNKWKMSIKHPRKINKKNNCKRFESK